MKYFRVLKFQSIFTRITTRVAPRGLISSRIAYLISIILISIIFCSQVLAEEEIISTNKIAEIKDDLKKARHSRINRKIALDIGMGMKLGIIKLDKYPSILSDTVIKSAGEDISMSIGFNILSGLRTILTLTPSNGEYERDISNFLELAFSSKVGDISYDIKLGGPNWGTYFSPLVVDRIRSEGGELLFDVDTTEDFNNPIDYYYDKYSKLGIEKETIEGGGRAPGEKGMYLNLKFPSKWTFSSWIAKLDNMYQDSSLLILGKTVKEINDYNIGLCGTRFIINPNSTELNDEEAHLLSLSLGKQSRKLLFYYENAVSIANRPKDKKEEKGTAAMLKLISKENEILFITGLTTQFRAYYASPEYYGKLDASKHKITGVYNPLPVFSTDVPRPVFPIREQKDFYANAYSFYLANTFDLLAGKFKATFGMSEHIKKTDDKFSLPRDLNSDQWGSVWWLNDYDKTWDDEELMLIPDYVGLGRNNYIYEMPTKSRKHFSLFRLDLYYDLLEWFDAEYPIFYVGRFIFSGISVNKLVFPTSDSPDKILYYKYKEHFLAFGISPEFYLVGFFAKEDNLFGYSDYEPVTFSFTMEEIGYGAGFDLSVSGGMSFHFRARYFDHTDKEHEAYNFNGYEASLFVQKRMSYW